MATTNLGRIKPIHRGAYDPDFLYTPLDIVRYQGASYFCVKASQGNVPQDGEFFMAITDGDARYAQIAGGANANFAEAPQIDGQSMDERFARSNKVGSAAYKKTGTGDDELPTTQQIRDTFDIHVPDPLRRSVEAATGGLCTVERTPNKQPCYMFVVPKLTWDDLVPSGELGTGTHEAFIENGVEKSELLVGMFMAAEINGELVSQPRTTGLRSINWDQSVSAAQGVGMNLLGNWEWSAIAFWCMANGFQPRGNTNSGKSHSHPHERGVYDGDGNGAEYTLAGSGPNAWRHNNAANGIADLVGNRWEWVWGFKMQDGRILMAPDNDRSLAESGWVDTGWDMPGGGTWASQDSTGAPQSILRALIMPNGVADPDGNLWTNLEGERFPRRGGTRSNGADAGIGALDLFNTRTNSSAAVGLRLSRLV